MLKPLFEFAKLIIGGSIILAIIACLLAVGGTWLRWAQQRTQASQVLDKELAMIDVHFNASQNLLSPNLSNDVLFPPQVNSFVRKSTQSGDILSPCDKPARFEQATYETTQEAIVVLTIYYCRGKPMTVNPKMIIASVGCGDMAGAVLLRGTVQTPYVYSTCPAMFSGAEYFAGMIAWANGGSVFSLYGLTSKEVVQFLQDYRY